MLMSFIYWAVQGQHAIDECASLVKMVSYWSFKPQNLRSRHAYGTSFVSQLISPRCVGDLLLRTRCMMESTYVTEPRHFTFQLEPIRMALFDQGQFSQGVQHTREHRSCSVPAFRCGVGGHWMSSWQLSKEMKAYEPRRALKSTAGYRIVATASRLETALGRQCVQFRLQARFRYCC